MWLKRLSVKTSLTLKEKTNRKNDAQQIASLTRALGMRMGQYQFLLLALSLFQAPVQLSKVLIRLVRCEEVFDAVVVLVAFNAQQSLFNQRHHATLHSAWRHISDDQRGLRCSQRLSSAPHHSKTVEHALINGVQCKQVILLTDGLHQVEELEVGLGKVGFGRHGSNHSVHALC